MLSGKLLASTKQLRRSVRCKQNISALDFNIFGGIDSCGALFLGNCNCNCNSVSVIAFLSCDLPNVNSVIN